MPKKVIIDRSKWLNAYTRFTLGPSFMLDRNGNMCCLGFVCAAEGVRAEDLLDKITPRYVNKAPYALLYYGDRESLAETAIEYNDNPQLTTVGRENALKLIFASEGTYELEFVGEYPSDHASSNT